jgi:hypothetical protein
VTVAFVGAGSVRSNFRIAARACNLSRGEEFLRATETSAQARQTVATSQERTVFKRAKGPRLSLCRADQRCAQSAGRVFRSRKQGLRRLKATVGFLLKTTPDDALKGWRENLVEQ